MADNTQPQPEMTESRHQTTIRMDSLSVHDNGRVTIPAAVRDGHELVERSLLALRLVTDGDREQFNETMVSGGRVTIPKRLRDKHDIDDGDDVDIELVN